MRAVKPEEPERLWTPANVVTMVRICLVPLFVAAILSPWPEWFGLAGFTSGMKSLVAAGVFILISCTDWIDGYLARSRGEVTDFGKFMDPLADKILVVAALLALIELDVLPTWPVLIILAREFIVSGIRMIAASKGEVIAASWYGKAKTVFQIVAIVLFIAKDGLRFTTAASAFGNPLYLLSWVVMLIALALTIVSMLDYLVKARHLLGLSRSHVAASSAKGVPNNAVEDADLAVNDLACKVVETAIAAGTTVGTAESLTGGLISAALTSVPGSSAVVRGAVVSYVNDVKSGLLGVDAPLLAKQGAVNADTACAMAKGACKALGADVAVAVTGIAGPGGAEPGKPVGTVWVAICAQGETEAFEHRFDGDRENVRTQTSRAALDLMLQAVRNRATGCA